MKTKILLCAGLLAIGTTITLESTGVIAKGLPQRERSSQKNAIVSEKNADYYNRSGITKFDVGDYSAAIADYTRAIEINPNFGNAYYNRGLAKYNIGNYAAAIADYNQALKINPNDSDYYNNRGVCKNRLGKLSEAMIDFTKALKINPNNSNAFKNLNGVMQALREEEQNTLDHINRVRNAQQAGFK